MPHPCLFKFASYCVGNWLIFLTTANAPIDAQQPTTARIESVVMLAEQPHASDPAVIWIDQFDDAARQRQYPEQSGLVTDEERFGDTGRSLEMFYGRGARGVGGRKIFFGDSPTYRERTLRSDESFDELYWRIYVKHPFDWQGGGAGKLSRATSLVPPGWRQAMIAHVWSVGDALTLDPASGVLSGEVVTTRYNDFPNLRWLGNQPVSEFKLSGADGLGWWVCVEAHVKLNTPGKKDGKNQLWIDGRLAAERTELDWRGTYTERGINAVFLEAYWNEGSPVDQSRWIDNFVVSTAPIGPVVCSANPKLLPTTPTAADITNRQVEVAEISQEQQVVWKSTARADTDGVVVDVNSGEFCGSLEGANGLLPNRVYVARIREQSGEQWSAWSPWHQAFRVAATASQKP